MSVIDWALYSERAVGRGSLTYTDVINRPLREVMTISGQDPDASFPGFSLAGHTHDASAVVSGTLAPARGGTGLSSPTAGGLLVAAAAAAMTLLAPGASGQVVKSNGTAWAPAAIVSADISDAVSTNTPSRVVIRDASGNFAAGLIAANISGNAATAAQLATPRAINGVNFDGSAPITVKASTTNALTIGAHLTGSSFDGSSAITIATDATAANTVGTIVARDGSGNFAAGVITASFTGALTGNAATATKLAAAVNINGVSFDGSASITVPAAAATLTGTTLASNVVASSLTGVGILTAGTWQATIVAPAFGGTGVANANTITLGGNINTASAFATVGGGLTLTVTGATNVTLPTSGTLVNSAVTALPLISVGTLTTGVWNATAITDAFLATISTAGKVATGAVAPGTFASGAFAFQGAVSGITTLATSSTINGQTISSAASFTGSVTAATHIRTTGTVTAHVASSIALDYAGGFGRVFVEGPDPGTNGSFLVTLARSDGSSGIAAILSNATGTNIAGAVAIGATLAVAAAASVGTSLAVATGLTVSSGTTSVQALTATTGAFSSDLTAAKFQTAAANSALLLIHNAAGHNAPLIGNVLGFLGSGSADDAAFAAFGALKFYPGNGVTSALSINSDLTATFSSSVSMQALMATSTQASSTVASLVANSTTVEFNGSFSRFMAVGPNGTTKGSMQFWVIDTSANAITALTLSSAGAAAVAGPIATGTPSGGTSGNWKLGSRVAAAVSLVTSQYIELDVNGTLYKLATVS